MFRHEDLDVLQCRLGCEWPHLTMECTFILSHAMRHAARGVLNARAMRGVAHDNRTGGARYAEVLVVLA